MARWFTRQRLALPIAFSLYCACGSTTNFLCMGPTHTYVHVHIYTYVRFNDNSYVRMYVVLEILNTLELLKLATSTYIHTYLI